MSVNKKSASKSTFTSLNIVCSVMDPTFYHTAHDCMFFFFFEVSKANMSITSFLRRELVSDFSVIKL